MYAIFDDIAAAANLKLNCGKCVLIPLWIFDANDVRQKPRSIVPQWQDFQINSYRKGLGFMIGTGAHDVGWQSAISAYSDMCKHITSLGLPILQRILLYSMIAVSKFCYQSQLRDSPEDFLKLETNRFFAG